VPRLRSAKATCLAPSVLQQLRFQYARDDLRARRRSSIFGAFECEIAKPIDMQDYQPSDGRYFTGAASVYPAYPIKMSARDLAHFALLYLNKGRWQDRQIIPAAWVDESTRVYSHSEWGPGYGYLWWTGPISVLAPSVNLPDGAFFAAGTGGKYAFVISGPRSDRRSSWRPA
jgi:CubicO group peptidase (beta-lactamase class C family)